MSGYFPLNGSNKKAETMDEIAIQAHQGSVAAIIQLLNDKLADSGVRTRAIFVDNVLQLLCEAAKPEQLEQSQLVVQVRQILEEIAPRGIRRVNINSRIVREQQLLWLEEINRDPGSQVLWSEEIILAKPNILKRLTGAAKTPKPKQPQKQKFPKSTSSFGAPKRQFWRGILIGSASLLLILVVVRLAFNEVLNMQLSDRPTIKKQPVTALSPQPIATPSPNISSSQTASLPAEPFVEAVRLAEQAASIGQTATTYTQWLDIATKWQKASDLMATVPSTDNRYKTAQNRILLYSQNSEAALRQAKKIRSQP